jgi:hypothetical protein
MFFYVSSVRERGIVIEIAISLARTPLEAASSAADLVKPSTACLLAE